MQHMIAVRNCIKSNMINMTAVYFKPPGSTLRLEDGFGFCGMEFMKVRQILLF